MDRKRWLLIYVYLFVLLFDKMATFCLLLVPDFLPPCFLFSFVHAFSSFFPSFPQQKEEQRKHEEREKRAREKERPDYSVMAQRVVEETEVGEGDLVRNQVMRAFFLQRGRIFPDGGHHECRRGPFERSNSHLKRVFHLKFRIFHSGFSYWTNWTNHARVREARQIQTDVRVQTRFNFAPVLHLRTLLE